MPGPPGAGQGRCDKCGGELYQRDDDRAETIRQRLQLYHRQAADLIRFYRDRGLLVEADGSLAPSQVTEAVRGVLSRPK